MKYLVKFCNSKYNIQNNCDTLNFGTLKYYSTIEGKRRDVDEGNIEEGLPPGTIHQLKDGPINFLGAEFHANDQGGGTIAVGANGQISKYYNFNCFVFCMSYLERKDIRVDYGKELFGEDIDSFYAIPENRINSFVHYLTFLLDTNLKKTDFANKYNSSLEADWGKQFALRYTFRPVEYSNKKYIDLRDRIDPKKIINKLIFTKNSSYSKEKEFRIALIPYLNSKPLICNNENKLIKTYPNVFDTKS